MQNHNFVDCFASVYILGNALEWYDELQWLPALAQAAIVLLYDPLYSDAKPLTLSAVCPVSQAYDLSSNLIQLIALYSICSENILLHIRQDLARHPYVHNLFTIGRTQRVVYFKLSLCGVDLH